MNKSPANKNRLLVEIQNHVDRKLYATPYSNKLKDGRLRTKLWGYKGTIKKITQLATDLRNLGWTQVSVDWLKSQQRWMRRSVTIRAVPPAVGQTEVDRLFNDVKVNGGYPLSVKSKEDVCAGTFVVVRYQLSAGTQIAMLLNDAPYNAKRPEAREHTLQIFTVARNKVGAVVTQPGSDGGVRALIGDEYITQTQIVGVLDDRSAAFVKLFE